MQQYDAIILGGGPSRLSTALHLTQIAPHLTSRILILEKEHYPRFKLCAGGLVIDAEIILERLGLDIRVSNRHTFRVIRRDEFDA